MVAAALALGSPLVAHPARASEPALRLQQAQSRPMVLDAQLLRAHATETIDVRWQRGEKLETARFTGVRVGSLLALMGAPTGTQRRGPWLHGTVTAIGADGCRVVFGLGELDAGLTGRRAIVAWARDGVALDGAEGALRLVIEGDTRPSRSVRQLVELRLVPPAAPTQ